MAVMQALECGVTRPTIVVLLLITSFFVAGVAEPFTSTPGRPYSAAAVVHIITIGVLCYVWCRSHAAARGVTPPRGSMALAGFLPVVGVPLYFFRSMPWRRALGACLKALGLLIVMVVVFLAGFILSATLMSG